MGNKHEVLGSKAKLWGSGDEAPAAGDNRDFGWRRCLAIFVVFIKIPHFEAYLSLNFSKNLFLSLG